MRGCAFRSAWGTDTLSMRAERKGAGAGARIQVVSVGRNHGEASSNGRTADFGSAYEGSNPSASAKPPGLRSANVRAEVKPLAMPERFALIALGQVPRALLGDIGTALTQIYGPPVVLAPAQQRPDYAFNKDRNQYHSTAVLRRLSQLRVDAAAVPILGVTDVDLFVPDAPFVFGEADRDARSAVVSFHRLAHGPDGKAAEPERLKHRVQVEGVHEIGHLLGLAHCQDVHCAMFLSHKPSDCDRKGLGLCGACRGALGLG
jgi:archaemetzincin